MTKIPKDIIYWWQLMILESARNQKIMKSLFFSHGSSDLNLRKRHFLQMIYTISRSNSFILKKLSQTNYLMASRHLGFLGQIFLRSCREPHGVSDPKISPKPLEDNHLKI